MYEKFKLISILSGWFHTSLKFLIPALDLLKSFVVKLVETLGVFAESKQLFGTKHEH
jgi:hypothetical protein